MDAYILRPNIQEFMFLIDCRRSLNEEDLALYEYIASKRPVRLILTKSDKVNQSEAQRAKAAAPKKCPTPPLGTHIVSASKLKGIDALRTQLFKPDETFPREIDGEAGP
jgi:GTP-binding protein EngB required for normal cell division